MPENTLPFGFIEIHKLSGIEEYDLTSHQQIATRVFRGPWASRQDFIRSLLPGVNEANGEINFSDPAFYPAINNLMATKVKVDGGGKSFCTGPEGMIEYEEAILTVTYNYVIGSSGFPPVITYPFPNFTVVTGDISSELFTFQKEEIVNPDDPFDPPIKEFRFLCPLQPINIKILFHPNPKFTDSYAAAGKVNSGNFLVPKINITCPTETLLYHGMTYSEKGFIFGQQIWELDHKFTLKGDIKSLGQFPNWNQIYNRKGVIVQAKLLNGQDPYLTTNFNLLFNQQVPNP